MRFPLTTGRILVYGKPVDMRKGFDGLTALVKQALQEDPLSGDLFLFLSRSGKLSKALLWDRTGFIVIAKRLEKGSFRLRNQAEKLQLTPQALELLLDGIPAGGTDASLGPSGQ